MAVVMLAGGCSGGGEVDAKPSPSVTPEAPEMVPEPVVTETEETFPRTPEGDLDRLAAKKGWAVEDSLYEKPSDLVTDICESLPVSAVGGASRPQWLVESGQMEGDRGAVLSAGVPKLCPKWSWAVKAASSGRYERWFGDGEYEVRAVPPAKGDVGATIRRGRTEPRAGWMTATGSGPRRPGRSWTTTSPTRRRTSR
ncbi:hypothetical protein [Streptomyces sp. Wb2n-11]|uniref:hypothetical protein n=1 Tax=Streptomyces sp. Wb2n-11 TaxID=1030533 RepID=UPI00159EBDE1|nr:hypothetical protein [Streptomyces sp. Wb2n-11]